jgi:Na+/melibiose symporter-like transporter
LYTHSLCQGYYGLLLALVAVLVAPVVWLREPPAAAPPHSLPDFARELWGTLQNQTTLYLIVYAIGIGALTNFPSICSTYMQYYVIGLTNFQAGIDTVTSYAALVLAVWLFQVRVLSPALLGLSLRRRPLTNGCRCPSCRGI